MSARRTVENTPTPDTKLRRAAENAGFDIPKILMNLRASRATEHIRVIDRPPDIVSEWCRHSETIADEYYRMPTDEGLLSVPL